ncbi:MAG: nucleotidyltransferase domain-containing protein [Patescibacteria group bacterium]
MNGLELNKIKQFTIDTLKNVLRDNLFAVISVGSMAWGNYKELWSDIDILIVVEKLDLEAKRKIAIVSNVLEKRYKKHFGINIISKQEFNNPVLPAISLEGKTLQAILELKMFPDRMIFCKEKITDRIYSPTKMDIKKYSISNIAMFLLRNRRILSGKKVKAFKDHKNIIAKEMRASFIITKLAIQYFIFYTCSNNEEVIRKAEKLFPDFDFQTLRINLKIIDRWNKTKGRSQLNSLLKLNDSFIENFSHYVFKKAQR